MYHKGPENAFATASLYHLDYVLYISKTKQRNYIYIVGFLWSTKHTGISQHANSNFVFTDAVL